MPQKTKTKFFNQATATCSNCNSVYTLPSALEKITLDICGNCHPFYTGQDVVVDTAGRIELFEDKMAKTKALQTKKSTSKKKRKVRKITQNLEEILPKNNHSEIQSQNSTDKPADRVSLQPKKTDTTSS